MAHHAVAAQRDDPTLRDLALDQPAQRLRHLAVEQPHDALDVESVTGRMEARAGLEAVGGGAPRRPEQHGLVGRGVGAGAVEEIDVGAAGNRHLAAHPAIGAVVARLHGEVLARRGVGQEDAQAGAELQALDGGAPARVVDGVAFAHAQRPLVHRLPQQPLDVGH